MIAALYEEEYSPINISVSAVKPELYIETEYGKGSFQEILEKAGAKLSADTLGVDIFLKTTFTTTVVGKTDDFYTSSCTIKMQIFDNQKNLLEQKTWPAAKGVHTNQLSADNKAIENAIKQVKYSWIQKLIMEHCKD